jgi:hypothetical protein
MLKHSKIRLALPALVALGCSLGAASAQAGGVQWSVGIYLPPPPMVVYETAPQVVYEAQPRVIYAPQPRPVYATPRVVYAQPEFIERREWYPPRYDRGHGHGHRHEHRHGHRRGGWEHEAYADRY